MKAEAYLGLDIGGTGVKAGVFSRDGRMLGFSRRLFAPTISAEGHVDISIDVIYKASRAAVREAATRSRANILAMAVSSQGETFVTLDARDRPLHDAIVWYDSRAEKQAAELSEAMRSATGRTSPINAILSVCKIRWLQEHRPALMRRSRRFLLLPDYIAYRLTGSPAIDPNTADSTGMTAGDGSKYDSAILAAAGIDLSQLSPIVASGKSIGPVLKPMAKEWGLAPETLLVSGTNDQYAGALGAGNYRPGILSETSGTCLAMVTLTKKRSTALSSGWFHGCFPIPGYWFIMAFSKTSGVVLDWFRKTMASGVSFDDLNKAAAKVPIGSKGLCMVPHFDGMISPVPNQRVRGAFAGLTLGHDRAHLYRSILEGLTFNLVANLKLMQARGMEIEVIRSIGGGAVNPLWLQMKADVAGLPVELPAVPEAATLGAAMLAAYGRGDYESLEDTSRQLYHCRQVIKPNPANQDLYQQAYENYNRIMERMIAVYA